MILYQSTSEFSELLFSFRLCFSKRSWPYLTALAVPWLLRSGQRTVRRLARRAGWKRHEASFYRFLSHFKFKPELFAKLLLLTIVGVFGLERILLAVDDTLCPKWGKRIFGTSTHFDHVRRPRPGYIWGHNWIVLAVIVNLFGMPVSIPFMVRLYRSQKTCPKGAFKTRLQIVAEELEKVRSWISPMKPVDLVADGAYNNKSLLDPLAKLGIPLVSRLRLDAVLRKDAPKRRRKGTRGRKPRYGERLPALRQIANSGQGWKRVWANIYGKRVRLKIKTFDAWWAKAGIKIRVVITRDPKGARKPCFLSSTDLTLTPIQIVERFSYRWSIEQCFADAKLGMGLDSAEVRSENSVLRHAIFTFALVAWVRIWAKKNLSGVEEPPTSFAGQLAVLRGDLMTQTIFASSLGRKLSKRNCEDLARLAV